MRISNNLCIILLVLGNPLFLSPTFAQGPPKISSNLDTLVSSSNSTSNGTALALPNVNAIDCKPEDGKFLCASGTRCINGSLVCDKVDHCGDGSDEFPRCKEPCKLKSGVNGPGGCEQLCLPNVNLGRTCYCNPGYIISTMDKDWCKEIDECQTFGSCSQMCTNTPVGSYTCSCLDGFKLEADGKTCTPEDGEPQLIYALKKSIKVFSLKTNKSRTIADRQGQTVGVTFDARRSWVYWTDISEREEGIHRARLNGSNKDNIINTGLVLPEGIAYDWIGQNIYFTDSNRSHVGVCDSEGLFCTILFRKPTDKPREIALHPALGYLFVTDWGAEAAIIRAGMDGSKASVLIKELKWPNGISIDHGNGRIYWSDAHFDRIETSTLDGEDRRTVSTRLVKHPFSLDVFGDTIFWSDWTFQNIQSCNKFTGDDFRTLITSNEQLHGLTVFHSAAQPSRRNPCAKSPCSHLCVLSSSKSPSFKCLCPIGMILQKEDKTTCIDDAKKPKLLIAHNNVLKTMRFDSIGGKNLLESKVIPEVHSIQTLAYNPLNETYILSDRIQKTFYEYDPKTDQIKVLVNRHLDDVKGMAIDVIGENLYWTDAGKRTVEVMSLRSQARYIMLREADKPTDIVIVPELKELFIAIVSARSSSIIRIGMNGYQRSVMVQFTKGRGEPIALAYNRDSKQLYWVDAERSTIEYISVDGRSTFEAVTYAGNPYSIATLGKNVYWADRNTQKLNTLQISDFSVKPDIFIGDSHDENATAAYYITGQFYASMVIIQKDLSFAADLIKSHECSPNGLAMEKNGEAKCSHICLVSADENVGTCVCPVGMYLGEDGMKCSNQMSCYHGQFTCSDGQCIDKSWQCDGTDDCSSGEDERNCTQFLSCRPSDFICESDNICLPGHWKCDGESDCADGSDEKECTYKECISDTDFRCKSGRCIPKTWVCDHNYDCPDHTDEENCDNSFVSTEIRPVPASAPSSGSSSSSSRDVDKDKSSKSSSSSRRKETSSREKDYFNKKDDDSESRDRESDKKKSSRDRKSKGKSEDKGSDDCKNGVKCGPNSDSECITGPCEGDETEPAPATILQNEMSGSNGMVTGMLIGIFVVIMLALVVVGGVFYLRKHGVQRPKILIRPYTQRWVKYVNHPMQRFFGSPPTGDSRVGEHIYEDVGFPNDEERGYHEYSNPGYEEIDSKNNSLVQTEMKQKQGTTSAESLSFGDSGIMNVNDSESNSLTDDYPDDFEDGHYQSYSQRDKLIDKEFI